ncbi:MAG: amidohydrolase family protein [Armatimonadota bacterium]
MTRRDLLASGAVAAGTTTSSVRPTRSRTPRTSALLGRLIQEAKRIYVIDTHEHLCNEEQRISQKVDLFHWFSHYASSDLVSAGMPPKDLDAIRDVNRPLDERWHIFAPYWRYARTTAYGRALLIAARDLYSVEDINDSTYTTLSERIAQTNKPGLYRWVLKEKARIQVSINDYWQMDMDGRYFVPAVRFDHFITPNRGTFAEIQKGTGVSTDSLDSYVQALEKAMADAKAKGMVAVKSGLAYSRTLRYDRVAKSDAEREFEAVLKSDEKSWHWGKPLQDFMMHRVAQCAGELGVPFQIHTGLQEGNGNIITNSNPTGLVPLFFDYPNTRFDLFHGAYPYCSELATLAKNFRNVYIDMCWLNIISPAVSRRMLDEWIETVPINKIMGFGGDYLFVEGAYGHVMMARENIARTLAAKVEEGYFTEDEALTAMRRLLRENPAELFGVGSAGGTA